MKTILSNANIIVGEDKKTIENGYVVINNETNEIVEVGDSQYKQNAVLDKDCKTIDLDGAWLLPGLINCHVHLMRDGSSDPDALIRGESMEMITLNALKNAKRHFQLGITTVRDVGSPGLTTLAVKKAVQQNLFKGPNVYSSGTPLIMTGGHFRMGKEVDGEDGVRKGTRQLLKSGVDVVKLFATGGIYSEGEEPGSPQLTRREIEVAVEEAHKRGIPVACHAQGLTGIHNCLQAGVDTIEHAIYADDEALSLFVEKGTYMVPTMIAMVRIADGKEAGIPAYAVEKAKKIVEIHFKMLEKAVKLDIRIATGTDAGSPCNPPEDFFAELEIMRQAGMSELDILQSSTSIAAKALGAKRLGVIKEGARADILAVESNPINDLKHLQNIKMVIKNGDIVSANKEYQLQEVK